MSCEQLSDRLPDYWAGRLSEADRRAFEAHLAGCDACRAEAEGLTDTWQALGALAADEPSSAMRGRFDAMLDAWQADDTETATSKRTLTESSDQQRTPRRQADTHEAWPADDRRTSREPASIAARARLRARQRAAWSPIWRPALQMAAALLVAAGAFAAGRFTSGATERAALAHTEVTELRQELRDMRQMMTLTLLQQQSATERLRGVSWSAQVDRPGGPVLDALLDTLARDPNVNVRLASIEALTQFAQDARVRRSLVGELATNRQDSPLVQIALIDALVDMKERDSVAAMRTLAADETVNKAVRRRATTGADTLSKSL